MQRIFCLVVGAALALPTAGLADDLAPMSLNSYSVIPARISTAVVEDQSGRAIGIVEKVATDLQGRPISLKVLRPGGSTIVVGSAEASYDPITNEVVTAVSVQMANAGS